MGGKKKLEDCRTGRDFNHYVVHDDRVREIRQNGSHLMVKGPLPGTAVFPNHAGDMATGTRRSVVKMLMAIGLGLFMTICFLMNLPVNASFQDSTTSTNTIVETIDGILCDMTGDASVCK